MLPSTVTKKSFIKLIKIQSESYQLINHKISERLNKYIMFTNMQNNYIVKIMNNLLEMKKTCKHINLEAKNN